ncbi:MAG: hypothetical protein KDA37_15360 [Planctomycetales bacterium]|nr:hypothetical protein [Planctomycetales bacterium]
MSRTAKLFLRHATLVAALAFVPGVAALAGAPGFYAAPPVASHHAEAPPYAGTQNYGLQVRPFRYGWFGAEHFYPTNNSHQDYYGDVMRWSRWRRY